MKLPIYYAYLVRKEVNYRYTFKIPLEMKAYITATAFSPKQPYPVIAELTEDAFVGPLSNGYLEYWVGESITDKNDKYKEITLVDNWRQVLKDKGLKLVMEFCVKKESLLKMDKSDG